MRNLHQLKPLDVERRLSKQPGMHSDGGGLSLRVSSAAARSWVYRFMINGEAREMGLGAYPDVSLADARAFVETVFRGNPPLKPASSKRKGSTPSLPARLCALKSGSRPPGR